MDFAFLKNANTKVEPKTQHINFTTLLSEMTKERQEFSNTASGGFILQNLSVRFDTLDRLGMDKRFKEGGEILYVNHDLSIMNVDFDETYWLVSRNIYFKGFFKIQTCKNVKMIFKDCIFDKNVKINANQANFLKFENCEFRHGFMYQFNNLSEYITFENCTFGINMTVKEDRRFSVFNTFDIEHHLFDFSNKTEPFDLNFIACKFLIPDSLRSQKKYQINITQSNFKNLRFENNIIKTNLNLSATTVENEFQLEEGLINGKIIIDALNLNPQNARVEWSLLAGHKISVFDHNNKIINGLDKIEKEKIYNRLIGCYSTFYQIFKSQGNRFYANNTYVEWKNIETNYLNYVYKQNNDSQIYFIYLMNLFLRDFCSYGTDPLESIYLSGIVILLFGFLYFFIPSPINSTRVNLIRNIQQYLKKFKTNFIDNNNTPSTNFFGNNQQITPNNVIESNANNDVFIVPFHLAYLIRPINRLLIIIKLLSLKLLSKLNYFITPIFKNSAVLSKITFIFLITLFYFYLLVMRILDAITLSLNVFSTLGFGEIPINDSVRYLTIVEGFIGWFLLSIFSVCLISQVIQ